MGRCLRKCRAVAVAGDVVDVVAESTPVVPLTRSRSRSHARTHHPRLRPRKPPSRKSSARCSTSSAPAAPDRITTVASEPAEISAASAVCCSSNGSCQLAVEVFEFEFKTCFISGRLFVGFSLRVCSVFFQFIYWPHLNSRFQVSDSFEAVPVNHHSLPLLSRAEEMDTAATSTPPPERGSNLWERRGVTAPTEAEIEEFFAGREAEIRKRFTEKYNFDVEKDVPLEGRYEWVRLLVPESSPPPPQKQQQVQPFNSS